MFVIAPYQMKVFEDASLRGFVRRMLQHFKEHFPDAVEHIGLERLGHFVELGLESARQYGFISERSVARYLDLLLLLQNYCAPGWHSHVQRILGREGLDSDSKLELMYGFTRRALSRANVEPTKTSSN